MLHAGISIANALDLLSESAASSQVRRILAEVVSDLREGEDLTQATGAHSSELPELFLRMISLGEKTGQLPEVLESLANHYDNNVRLVREFRSEITLPTVQFVAALIVIGAVIWFTGLIAEFRVGQSGPDADLNVDILGWGLQGTPGVIKWFGGWLILFLGVFAAYRAISLFVPALLAFHRLLLRLPVIGPCLRSFAIARFSWAYHLTQNAGVPVRESIDASLRATGNPHFISRSQSLVADLVAGKTIAKSFRRSGLFDEPYLQMVAVGEISGTVPEALNRLSPQFEDQAQRRLKLLCSAAATAIWGLVALFIIVLIFRMAGWYAGMIDQGLDQLNRMS